MANNDWRFIGQDLVQDHALAHVCGGPVFLDDIDLGEEALEIYVVGSSVAAASKFNLDLTKVSNHKAVVAVVSASDIPGENKIGPLADDAPVFAEREITYYGQPLFAVAAPTLAIAKSAARLAKVTYETVEPVVSINQAAQQKKQLSKDVVLKKGRSAPAIKNAQFRHSGHLCIGSQDHFYLEGQIAVAIPRAIDQLLVYSSTQDVFLLQQLISRSIVNDDVVVESLRVGGSFGGKCTQSVQWAVISALVATITKCPAITRLERDSDMLMTGKRHEFEVDYQVGFTEQGIIQGIEMTLSSRCGCSEDVSGMINDYALLHVDNTYYLKNITVTSKRYKTNTVTSSQFRGGGKTQGILIIERIIDEIAALLGIDPLSVRMTNLYGEATGRITHYGMRVEDDVMQSLIDDLKRRTTYQKRRKEIIEFNLSSPIIKRGIALIPVKLGVSPAKLNQAAQSGARVELDSDGKIHVYLSSVEMGQGLYIRIAQIVAEVFQVDPDQIIVHPPQTDLFKEFTDTTGSCSLELNGGAVQRAAESVKQQLISCAVDTYAVSKNKINFTAEGIKIGRKTVQFKTLVAQACAANLRLSAEDSLASDKSQFSLSNANGQAKGQPFSYFVQGAAVAEVAVDSLTGESTVRRVDILQDCGQSINPGVDIGQIEGGFVQGMGWVMMEELCWDNAGALLTTGTSSYKIPVCNDVPEQFNVKLWKKGKVEELAILGSKTAGELPLALAISVYSALIHAIASVKSGHMELPKIDIPATPESILMAIQNY